MHAKGRLPLGAALVNESILGTTMTATILRETTLAGLPAIVPQVAGQAHLVGHATWIIDRDDPLRTGFLLR